MEIRRRCNVPGCINNKRLRPDLAFFRTPKDPERAKTWMEQINLPADAGKNVYFCEEHFEKPLVNSANKKIKRLESLAVPTLNLPLQSTCFTENEETLEDSSQNFIPETEKQQEESQTDAGALKWGKMGQNVSVSLNTTINTSAANEELYSQAGTSQTIPNKLKNTSNLYRDKIVFDDDDDGDDDDDDDFTIKDPLNLSDSEPSIIGKRHNKKSEALQTSKKKKIESCGETKLENADAVLTIIPSAARMNKNSKMSANNNEQRIQNENNNLKTASFKFHEYVYPKSDSKQSKTNKFVASVDKDETTNDVSTAPYTLKLNSITKRVPKDAELNTIKGVCSTTVKIHEIQVRMESISTTRKAYQQLSLKLYFRFPKEYKILQNLLYLPCVSELKDVFKDTIISLEKDSLFAKFFMCKITCMTLEQRQCFICVGEIDIKPRLFYNTKFDQFVGIHDCDDISKPKPATKAVVLIVQGIYCEWKQLVAVGYLEDKPQTSIRNWIEQNIKALYNMGIYIRAVVTNNTSIEALSLYSQKYLCNSGRSKYYCMNDISSLFKSFYFNFLYFDYMHNDSVAKSIDIEQYYELDKNRTIPLTPNITTKHINPQDMQELTLDHVLDVFNMTTAAAISTYIDLKILDESARHTVNLIIRMRNFYDLLNTGRFDTRNKVKEGFIGEDSQIIFLKEMLLLFEGLKLIDPSTDNVINTEDKLTSSVSDVYECIEKFKSLIKTILFLFDDLKRESFQHLPIWRFNTDAAEKFSEKVQNHSKSITKPTARAVDSVFRQIAFIQILKPSYENVTPITPKLNLVLEECQDIIKSFKLVHDKYEDQCMLENENVARMVVEASNYNSLDMKRKDGLIFIAGYLLRQCLYTHGSCFAFKAYIERSQMDNEAQNMSKSIQKEIENGTCVAPTSEFIEFVEAMEILFRTFMNIDTLKQRNFNRKVVYSMLRSMKLLKFAAPCQCMPLIYIKKIYVRFRIYHTLKYNNQRIKTACDKGIIINKL